MIRSSLSVALVVALLLLAIIPITLKANDIVVSSASLTGQDVSAGADNAANFTFARFDLNWSNSWRVSTGPNNWDAAWVFLKYRIESGTGCTPGEWEPATLSSTSAHHSVTTENGVASTIAAAADGTGVFIHRSGDGAGAIDWDQVLLRWNYGADGLLDACNVTVRVYAIEMVYVPQASFFAGDGSISSINGQLEDGTTGAAFQVTSENSFTLGGGGAGSMGNNNRSGQSVQDDFTDVTTQTLPAAYPKGFNAYYCMKYEISQEQYAEFLNVLTATQQLTRHGATVVNRFTNNGTSPPGRNSVKNQIIPSGGIAGTYGNDLDNDGTFGESNDGQNIAMNYMSGMDLLAYLDWAGLRPMTELELEKTMRGTNPAVAAEYAWGTTTIHASTYAALTNSGAGNELPNSPSTTAGNANYGTTNSGITGPLRVGIFATATSSRVTAGATYYGVMEMTGNVWELAVGLGHAAGRSFTGAHGDGSLDATGNANQDFWPGVNGNSNWAAANTAYLGTTGSTAVAGFQFRGGTWNGGSWLEVSDRNYSFWTGISNREQRQGGRGVRTAP